MEARWSSAVRSAGSDILQVEWLWGSSRKRVEEALLGCGLKNCSTRRYNPDSTLQPTERKPRSRKRHRQSSFPVSPQVSRGVQRISPGFTHHNPRIQPHHILSKPPRPGRHRRHTFPPLRTAREHKTQALPNTLPVHVTTRSQQNNTRATYSIDTSPSRPPPYIKAMAQF